MEAFTTVTGPAAVLDQANIDTDAIIRIHRLNEARMNPSARPALKRWAFETLRYEPDGSAIPTFFLNQPGEPQPILIAGPNFGCGSSREGAVWAVQSVGIRVVIAASFGAIFELNSFENGLLPIHLPSEVIDDLQTAAAANALFSVDLETNRITIDNERSIDLKVDSFRRKALLRGVDPLQLTMELSDKIKTWQRARASEQPWVWL